MTKNGEIYKCSICGNVVSVIENGAGTLVCCGKNMDILRENTIEDEGQEKHVPVISVDGNKVTVKIGSVPHPMDENHYIELIQLFEENNISLGKRLRPGDKPEVEFHSVEDTKNLKARILCNIHGLWVSQ